MSAPPLTIAIDAMGGDYAPGMVVQGLDHALARLDSAQFLLFGDENQLAPLLRRHRRVAQVSEVRHTDAVISNDARPAAALRTGQSSSMRLSIDAVARNEAEGVVSAGNTGALMAMVKVVLKTLPGVDRPAIASVFPTERGRSVILDLGANVECTADNLVQFAVMGEVFARKVLGLERPSVGLLNVGEEQFKGNDSVRGAARVLQASLLAIDFHGFIEGTDIGAGTVDVIVTDGFTGNVALKTAEGVAKLYTRFLRESMTSSLLAKLGGLLARPALRKMRARVDPRLYDGAMFLGLNGVVFKAHGGTDAVGFASAVNVAVELVADRVNDGIKEDFACVNRDLQNDPDLMVHSNG